MVQSDGSQYNLESMQSWETAESSIQLELDSSQERLREVGRKIEQSQNEVNKLARRNATITSNLQQLQAQQETVSKTELRSAYDAALDAQQRLFVMRGQVEKLQSEQESLNQYVLLLKSIQKLVESGGSNEPGSEGSFANVEMMIQAQEAERQRLSRQMHDGPAQALSNFILQTEIATRFFDVDQTRALEELQVLKNSAATTFQQVRDFIFELRPMMLDDLGLVPTIKRYVEAIQEQSGSEINVVVTGNERRLEPYIEVVVFRSVQELLNNALHHSGGGEIRVQLDMPESELRASVEDNGRGFSSDDVDTGKSFGIPLIKDRMEMLGGNFEIDSAPGQGARVSFRIPLRKQVSIS